MYLAYDTETTDLPRPHLEPDHRAQPHLLQFAGILFDENGTELDRLFTMVRPGRDALLSTHAFAAHGISLEEAFHRGVEVSAVFRWFNSASKRSTCIVGHNVDFDLRIMAIVAARLGETGWSAPPNTFCTMAQSTALVNLPPTFRMMAAGRFHPKSPSLSECMRHFFGEEHSDAHDAEADVRACIRIFRHLTTERTAA
ncbi:3'-5' exonuclease [Sphingomonas anseongensis]|uniref:3'-5' exonuclease n=1 Tax=Sphingomonas anseongensis TaxID=2908207 RepID=UPI003D69D4C0